MSDPFIAEIRIFAGNFAPRGWAFCDGQFLPIAQNTALFSLIGTIYGGDGRTTLALPDLMDRAPMHPGSGPGLSHRQLGQPVGVPYVALTEAQIPSHTHRFYASDDIGTTGEPQNNLSLATTSGGPPLYYGDDTTTDLPSNAVNLESSAVSVSGGGIAHDNMQPFLALTYIIALAGTYPPRS